MTLDEAALYNTICDPQGDVYFVHEVFPQLGVVTAYRESLSSPLRVLPFFPFFINEAQLVYWSGIGGVSLNSIRDICRKCGAKGSENTVRGKVYYWCSSCKDEC